MKMRNKILIVDESQTQQDQLEEILRPVIQRGGELFFAKEKKRALEIMKKELPQLVFVEASFVQEKPKEWEMKGVHVVVICQRHEEVKGKDFIVRPFRAHQVLEKCHFLDPSLSPPALPPM